MIDLRLLTIAAASAAALLPTMSRAGMDHQEQQHNPYPDIDADV